MKLNNKRRKLREIRQINDIRKFGKVKSYVKVSVVMLEDTEFIKTILEDTSDVALPNRVKRRFSYHLLDYKMGRDGNDFTRDVYTILKTFKAVEL